MSTDTPPADADTQPLTVQALSGPDFIQHIIRKTRATAAETAPSFRFLVRSSQDAGTTMYLEDAAGTFLRCEEKVCFFDFFGARVWEIDAAAALGLCERMLDWYADALWHRVMGGEELDAPDGVLLNLWVGHRTRPHHMPLDEAERLFGEAPRVTCTSSGPDIDWEAPDRLVGGDPAYERRRAVAQALFDRASQDNAERFAGAVYAAFLQAWQQVKKH